MISTDETQIVTNDPAPDPRPWAMSLDVVTPTPGTDGYTNARIYEGSICTGDVDAPCPGLIETIYRNDDGTCTSFIQIEPGLPESTDGFNPSLAPRVAAAIALLGACWEHQRELPSDAQLEMLAATIKGQAADIMSGGGR